MKIKKAYLLLFIVPFLSFTVHKYYLSLTQIDYKKETQSVQIIINVFMDDIEVALNEEYSIDLQLTSKNELKNNDRYFKQYLEKHIMFKIDDITKKYNYIGKEYEGDLVYFYLEIENIEHVKTIEITNTLLTDYFPKQENLIKTKVNKKHKSVLLTLEKNNFLLKF